MFIIPEQQMKLIEKSRVSDIVGDTYQLLLDEFSELVTTTNEALYKWVKERIQMGTTQYKLTSFDALQDYVILALQYQNVLVVKLPNDLESILTWPGMKDADKIAETEKLLLRKY